MDENATPSQAIVWSGLDLRSDVEGGSRAARDAVRESTWAPTAGRGERYELLTLVSRVRPAAFLSSLEVREEQTFDDALTDVTWHDDLTVTWSLRYRRVADTGPELVTPYAIYVLGVNPPPDLDSDEIAEFNAFYTNVHMPEVAKRRGALRASRYELEHELRPPAKGSPRFLACYEVDEDAAQQRNHVGLPYQRGPVVWQKHTTPWRFWYRRLAA